MKSLRQYVRESKVNESVVGGILMSTAIAMLIGVGANEIQSKLERGYFPILAKIKKWWGDNRAAKIIDRLKQDKDVREFLEQKKSYQNRGWRELLKSKLSDNEIKYLARITKDKVRAEL